MTVILTPYGQYFAVPRDGFVSWQGWEIVMSMAGIHDSATRDRCGAELARAQPPETEGPGRLEAEALLVKGILQRHGAGPHPIVRLPILDFKIVEVGPCRFNEIMKRFFDLDDEPHSRYVSLMEAYLGLLSDPAFEQGDLFATVLTGKLKAWSDETIFQLPQAITYALTIIPVWRKAALEWLAPHRETWVPDFLGRNPQFARLARLAATEVPGIPAWLRDAQPG